MPKAWSDAVKVCKRHPRKVHGRWCSCRTGWRYRLGLPDEVTGILGRPEWSQNFPTKEAADRHQRETRNAIADKSFVRDRGMTVGEYLTAWLERKRTVGRKATTISGYEGVIRNHLEPLLGRHRLGDLRPDHVQAMLDRLARESSKQRGRRDARPITAGTLVNIRAVLRAALNDAVRQQLVPRNVAAIVSVPTPRRAKPVALDDTRVGLFLAAADETPLRALWLVATVYGLRRAELVGLRWETVDEDLRQFWVRTTVLEVAGDHPCPYCGGVHRQMRFDTPKSAAGVRAYPLVPLLIDELKAHRARQDEEKLLFGSDYADHGLVFAQPDGNPWRPEWIGKEFRRLMRVSGAAQGLDKVPSIKVLRSTMVTNLHEAGTPLEVISKVTGHAGGEVTRDHYLRVSAERSRAEFHTVAERLAGQARRSDHLSDHRADLDRPP